ncbi:hypothetical protein [Nonomuraea dietziae]|uniref:hypothetical protein n=1 Tax=Nonomuraea dietziae TaxID=65515 RepID=UPI0031E27CA2
MAAPTSSGRTTPPRRASATLTFRYANGPRRAGRWPSPSTGRARRGLPRHRRVEHLAEQEHHGPARRWRQHYQATAITTGGCPNFDYLEILA